MEGEEELVLGAESPTCTSGAVLKGAVATSASLLSWVSSVSCELPGSGSVLLSKSSGWEDGMVVWVSGITSSAAAASVPGPIISMSSETLLLSGGGCVGGITSVSISNSSIPSSTLRTASSQEMRSASLVVCPVATVFCCVFSFLCLTGPRGCIRLAGSALTSLLRSQNRLTCPNCQHERQRWGRPLTDTKTDPWAGPWNFRTQGILGSSWRVVLILIMTVPESKLISSCSTNCSRSTFITSPYCCIMCFK